MSLDMKPDVSICCVTYNHAGYIEKALRSFLKQHTNFQYEILIHDDCSTDGTEQIILHYQNMYPNIIKVYTEKENQFSQGSRKMFFRYLFPYAKGKYIALCEGDDYWIDSEKLQKQYDFMEKNLDYSVITNKSICIDKKGKMLKKYSGPNVKTDCDLGFYDEVNCLPPTASTFFDKRKIDGQIPDWFFEKCDESGDYVMHMLLLTKGKCRYLSNTMSAYRVMVPGSSNERFKKYSKVQLRQYYQDRIDVLKEVDSMTESKFYADISKAILKLDGYKNQTYGRWDDRIKEVKKGLINCNIVSRHLKIKYIICSMTPRLYHMLGIIKRITLWS